MINSRYLLMVAMAVIGINVLTPIAYAGSQMKGVSLGEFSLGCDYYLIEDAMGSYTMVEWYGGTTTYSGDIIIGDLHSYGFKDMYDTSIDRSTRVWIEDWLLSQDRASEKLIDKCGWDKNILNYFSRSYGSYSTPTPSYVPTATCPLNSHENPLNRDKCLCDVGYSTNTSKTACVPTVSCPVNSYASGTSCICSEGYLMLNNVCVTYNQSCQSTFGPNSYGDKQYCYCSSGYEMNAAKTACLKKVQSPVPSSAKLKLNPTNSAKFSSKSSSSNSSFGMPSIVNCKRTGNLKTCGCPALYKVSKDGKQCVRL